MKAPVIVTLSSSPVIAAGIAAVIRSQAGMQGATVIEATAATAGRIVVERRVDIVIGDQWALAPDTVASIRATAEGSLAVVAVMMSMTPDHLSAIYDATVSIFDSPAKIAAALAKCSPDTDEESRKELSPREKDVIIGVVKGLSNKEIADRLNVSTHTVMTHRRNIAAKLQIHSPAGLTIYAIVSHLVNLDEVKDTI